MKLKLLIIVVILFSISNILLCAEKSGADNSPANENADESNKNQESEKYFSEKPSLKTRFGGNIETGVYLTHEAINSRATIGSINEIRLNASITYGTLFKVYIEPMFKGYYGARNNYYLFSRYGVFTQEQTDAYENLKSLGMNTNEQLNIDRGWVQIYKSFFKIRAGKQIIAWARAYSYNPTDKINIPNPLDPTALNPGVMGLTYEFRIFEDFNTNRAMFITGYFVLQDKLLKNTPAGIKTRFNFGTTEFALSYIYEAKEDALYPSGYKRKSHIGFDFFTQFLGIGFYIETTYRLEQEKDRDFSSQLLAAVGVSTTFSFKMSMRIEYIYYGPGKTDKSSYAPEKIVAMSNYFMARHYVFFMFDGDASRIVWFGLSGFFNVVDFSITLIPQIKLTVIENVAVEIGAFIFMGRDNSEMNGRFTLTDYKTFTPKKTDLAETQVYTKVKVSF